MFFSGIFIVEECSYISFGYNYVCMQDEDVSDERRKIVNAQTDENDVVIISNLKKVGA